MSLRMASALVVFAVAVSPSAYAEQVHFTGNTTVDVTVIKDVLKQIQLVGLAELNCGVVDSVEAEVLPPSYVAPATDNSAAPSKEIYEKWTVTMCGKMSPFLVGFWPALEGGTMFRVRHPFPVDAGPIDAH